MAGKVIRKEVLNKHEQELWDELKKHADEFKEYHGYTIEDIRRISVRKFLKMEGWKTVEDVLSFKTDVMHIGICPNCLNEYGIYQDLFGICNKCKKQFDIKQLYSLSSDIGKLAVAEFSIGKSLSDAEKAVVLDSAIRYVELSFTHFIKSAALKLRDVSEMGSGTLLVEAVFKKDKDLKLRTEESDRISDIFAGVKNFTVDHLSKAYVFDRSETTEV